MGCIGYIVRLATHFLQLSISERRKEMKENVKTVTLLDFEKGGVIVIKFSKEELSEMQQYDDFAVFLSTLEDKYQFHLTNCQYMIFGDEMKVRKIGFETTEEEFALEVLRNDVLKSERLEDYFNQLLNEKKEEKAEDDIRQMMTDFVIKHSEVEELVDELDLDHVRACSVCGSAMTEGYCIENGAAYYCSDECMQTEMTEEEYLDLYDDGNGDSYWTSWTD